MPVELLTSAHDFLVRTQLLRTSDPFRTNILGSVATAVADGSLTYDDYFWWVVTDRQDRVVGAAMRTAPHGMVLSPMPLDAVAELAQEVSIRDDQLPSVSGPTDVVETFLDRYQTTRSAGSLRPCEIEEQHLLYALKELLVPSVAGVMAAASPDDFDLILKWYRQFGVDTGVFMPNPEGSIRAGLGRNSYRFWIVNGEKVSLAGHAPLVATPTGNIARIGPVYTPLLHRRMGYAGVLTAMLSGELLNAGARVMLYTDALNPTSNGIYQRIGFEKIDENAQFKFSVENA